MNIDLEKPDGYDKHGAYWKNTTLVKNMALIEIKNQDNGFAKRKVDQVNQNLNEITETIELSTHELEIAIDRLCNKADFARDTMKLRVSNLKDIQNQLTTSIVNINKSISDKQLEHLVNNTEKLVIALQSLETLNKNGNLEKILVALKK